MHVIERIHGWRGRNCSLSCCGKFHRRDAGSRLAANHFAHASGTGLHHSCESISVGGALMLRFMIKKHTSSDFRIRARISLDRSRARLEDNLQGIANAGAG
jgi:hypothetical protein